MQIKKVMNICTIVVLICLLQGCNRNKESNIDQSDLENQLEDTSEEDTENSKEDDYSYHFDINSPNVEVVKNSEYNIITRGAARPSEDEIQIKEAAETGVEYIKEQCDSKLKDFLVDLIFVDGIPGISSAKWEGNIVINKQCRYQFMINAEDGTVDLVKDNFS